MPRPLRYSFILGLVGLGTAMAAVGGWRFARASAPVNGPIVLISIDALRADHLGPYGYRKVPTPAIDDLAADGIVFERAYSHVPQTLPAHASLLTGRLPFDTGVRDNVGFTLKADDRMLAQMLADRGFATAGVVSSYALRKTTGIGRGFSFFDSDMQAARPDMMVGEIRRDGAESEQIAERWLDQAGTSRVFLFLHLYDPHQPYAPQERYAQYSPYDAGIAYADEIVGRFVRYLKTHQLYDQSTIILLSDHGEGLGDHGEQAHGLFVYEEALRVPLVIKQAAGESAGRRVADLVQHVDVVPTILDLAKAPVPGNLPGRSLKPLLDGSGHLSGRVVYSESFYGPYHFGWSPLETVTDGRYRYIQAPRPELYDLQADPRETTNLVDAPIPDLRERLEQFTRGKQAASQAAVTVNEQARFDALGDVGQHVIDPAAAPVDPKDTYAVLETYRAAMELAVTRQWPKALTLLQRLAREQPEMADLWRQISSMAFRAGRFEQALEANKRLAALDEHDTAAYLNAAEALLRLRRLDDARREAMLAVNTGLPEGSAAAAAHELLARIALVRRDVEQAGAEAALAREADPTDAASSYIEGRVHFEQGRYTDALARFEDAVQSIERSHRRQVADLHYFLGETLVHLDRPNDAEAAFHHELESFPQNTRAWTSLVALYQADGRLDEARQALADLVRVNPVPDAYLAAARVWTALGDRRQAAQLRSAVADLGR